MLYYTQSDASNLGHNLSVSQLQSPHARDLAKAAEARLPSICFPILLAAQKASDVSYLYKNDISTSHRVFHVSSVARPLVIINIISVIRRYAWDLSTVPAWFSICSMQHDTRLKQSPGNPSGDGQHVSLAVKHPNHRSLAEFRQIGRPAMPDSGDTLRGSGHRRKFR